MLINTIPYYTFDAFPGWRNYENSSRVINVNGTVKSYGYPEIADPNRRFAELVQITGTTTATQQSLTRRWLDISMALFFISMVSAGQKKLKGNLLLIEQMHEMEKVIEELKRLNSVKDTLLSIVSHDIRAPLASLKSLLELLVSKNITATEFDQVVVEIDNHVVQVNVFVENLLYWAKGNRSRIKPSSDTICLHSLVNETISLLSFSARKKQVIIQTDVSEEIRICADAEMIKLVLRNLISNAIKFCNPNDKVYIRAISENEMVRISVVDTGQGISKKNIKTLFRVSHLSATGTDDEIGVGLGLTLCKEFVEKMGGNISVSSKEGEGSCFEFTAPRFIKNKASTEGVLAIPSVT